jgi:hypothetical protein
MTVECFGGLWIGESMRQEAGPALVWRIKQSGANVFVYPRLESELHDSGYFSGSVSEDGDSFSLNGVPSESGVARRIDEDHFYIAAFDHAGAQPHDVVFSRPGVPELSARQVWESAVRGAPRRPA